MTTLNKPSQGQGDDLYVLIKWPWVQEFMKYPWFRADCILYQGSVDQEHLNSAYFVPLERLNQIRGEYGIY